MRFAAPFPVILALGLTVAACEPLPPVELGPQGTGGLAIGGQQTDVPPAGTDDGTDDPAAGTDDAATDGLPSASAASSSGGGSLLDAGRGAAFAQKLGSEDLAYFRQAEISARGAFVGSTINWRNPGSGTAGTITPLSDRTIAGQQCRDFFLTATVGSRQHSETATACNTGSGWAVRAS